MLLLRYLKDRETNVKNEILSGLTVSLALIPEAVAFSIIAGVNPSIGIFTSFIMAFITSLLGGRPGMVSGATGAIAVVIVSLVIRHGTEYLFAAVVLMGLIQIAFGLLRLGKFIRLVPQAVVYGFLNGLAIVIFMSQLDQFKAPGPEGDLHWLNGQSLWMMLGLVALTIAIIVGLPKLTKAFPSSLAAILVISALVIGFNLETKTVGDIAPISASFPGFQLPKVPLNWETLTIIFPYSLIMALVGIIESLLTLTVLDEMIKTRGRGNKECVAQGVANMVNGFFNGMGGCAMTGQSIINVSSGGRTRVSTGIAGVVLLAFVLFLGQWIEQVPMAALVGLMIMVSVGTFEWASLRIIRNVPLSDVFVMFLVAGVTVVFHNLAVAVVLGVIISALTFAWENAKRIRARKHIDENGAKHYEIYGPLFFGSTSIFLEKFDVDNDPKEVIIDFKESRVVDHSAIETLNKVTHQYAQASKHVVLQNLSEDCYHLLKKADPMIDVNYSEEFAYRVATDEVEDYSEK